MLVVRWVTENGFEAQLSSYSQDLGCLNFRIAPDLILHVCIETDFAAAALIEGSTKVVKQAQLNAADPGFFPYLKEIIDASYARNQEKAS